MKIQEAANYIGVSVNTLKAMAEKGTIVCHKTAGGHRRFQREYLDLFMGVRPKHGLFDERFTLIYARCSTAKQKENLERQRQRLEEYCTGQGWKYQVIDEIASGINEKRKGIHKLIKLVTSGNVERVVIEYKDRLARFGYEYILAICKCSGVPVVVVNAKEQSYHEELAEDIMKILTCYSARFYGARGGKKAKKKTEAPETQQLALGENTPEEA